MCPFKCVKILCRSTPHRSLALDQLRLVNPRIGVLRFGRLVSSERNHTVAVFVNGLTSYTLLGTLPTVVRGGVVYFGLRRVSDTGDW